MPMLRVTADVLERSFDNITLARGEDYAERDRVTAIERLDDGSRFRARVLGSRREPYTVEITLHFTPLGTTASGSCSCPVHINCKHAAALAALFLEQDPPHSPLVSTPATPEIEASIGLPETADAGPPTLPLELTHWLEQAREATRTDADEYPTQVHNRLIYLLGVDGAPRARRAVVTLVQARRLKTGGYGKSSRWSPGDLVTQKPPAFIRLADERLLRQLLVAGEFGLPGQYPLGGFAGGASVLRAVLASGRCHFGDVHAPVLRLGAPRSARFEWRFGEDGEQHVAVTTKPPSTHVLPMAPPWYVDAIAGECGPLDTTLEPTLAEVIAGAPAIRPEHASAFRAELEATHGTRIPLPAVPKQSDVPDAMPIPVLRFESFEEPYRFRNAHDASLDIAALSFDYLGVRANRDSPGTLTRFQNGRLLRIQRNHGAEQAAHQALRAAGFDQVMNVVRHFPQGVKHDYTFARDQDWIDFVVGPLPHLQAEGWRLEFDDSFRFRTARAGQWQARLAPSGNDWFDLELGIDVDGKRIDLLPILLTALREHPELAHVALPAGPKAGASMLVRLDDGRLLPVPMNQVHALIRVLDELLDRAADDGLRVSRLDAMRLTELENAVPLVWDADHRLREVARRLAAGGIVPRQPPPAFGATLRSYQAEGVGWLQFLREFGFGGILADDMGLGKTVQALAHIAIEKAEGRLDLPALIVAPTSVVPNWRREAQRFTPDLIVHVSHGLKRRESFAAMTGADIVLTTYALLPRDREALLAREFHLVILDEAQQIKNAQTQAAKVVGDLEARHRLCLTGTPLENHLGELWSLFHFLIPGFLGDAAGFRRTYRNPIEKHGDATRRASLSRRIRPFLLRRTKEQVATELPPRTEIVRPVELLGAQRELYETVRASVNERVRAQIAARGFGPSRIVVLDALLKLRQVCCDPSLLKLENATRITESAKLDALRDMLRQLLPEGRRVLVFSQFTSMLAIIEREVTAMGIGYVKLTGETRDRERPVNAFQAGEVPLFLISLKAGGTGLNLTAADTVIHYDPWWNPAVERQATDRAHRIGQDKPVFVYKLIATGSVEEKIMAMQTAKAALAADILGDGATAGAPVSADDISALFEPLS